MKRHSSPAKLLLFGEHAAVYGYPAIGIPLPQKLSVALTEIPNNTPPLLLQFPQLVQFFPELSTSAPLYADIDSEIPIGSGFGSSGALCVSLVRALLDRFSREDLSLQRVWSIAHALEHTFHGTPSGIDTGLSTFESPCIFTKADDGGLPEVRFLEEPMPPIVYGFVRRNSTTATLVARLKRQQKIDNTVKNTLEELGEIATQALSCPSSSTEMGKWADLAHEKLQILGLSTPELDECIAYGRSCGATGGKLSGAGGGGAYVLFAPTYEKAKSIAEQLQARFGFGICC